MNEKENADERQHYNTNLKPKHGAGMDHGQLVILSSLTESLLRVLEEFQHHLKTTMDQSSVGGQAASMGEAFNAVELLFKVLVYENNLSDKYKLQLSKLQTTYVKIAASDPSFYHQESHPARKFLSCIVQGAKTYDVDGDEPNAINTAIEKALSYADSNPAIFSELLEDLNKKGLGTDKVLESCRQASAKLGGDVDIIVKAFINSTVQGNLNRGINETIKAFIQGPWQAYMYWIAMNQGVHGQGWDNAKDGLMSIIDLCDPNKQWDAQARNQAFNEVSKEIEAAFTALQMSSQERQEWISSALSVLGQSSPNQSCVVSFAEEKLKDKAQKAKAKPSLPEPASTSSAQPVPPEAALPEPATPEPDAKQHQSPASKAFPFDDADCEEIELTAPSPFNTK